MSRDRGPYLAIDLGASSGRAFVGTLGETGMRIEEVHRFRTPLIEKGGSLYWDMDALTVDVFHSLGEAIARHPDLRSVSVDSWGVDYVPLSAAGDAVRGVYAYRDRRTTGLVDEAAARIGRSRLYELTGTQFLDINTLPQIVADLRDAPHLLPQTATRLLIADYFLYRLSGVAVAERTLASTTQLVDIRTGGWSTEVLRAIGDDAGRWPRIVAPGTSLAPVHATLLPPTARGRPVVIASCSHDTAAAVAAVPATDGTPWAFISSGTWSLVGAETVAPILSAEALDAGFTNEAGITGTTRFLKNRMGTWVLEECMREWGIAGNSPAHAALLAEAERQPSNGAPLDVNAAEFGNRGNMLGRLASACAAQGTRLPLERGAIVRMILDSMAVSYRDALHRLDGLLGHRSEIIHIVGGGARMRLLNRLTADACGRRVVAGPLEATVLGNLLVQASSLGDIAAGVTIRNVVARSVTCEVFEPAPPLAATVSASEH